VSLIQRWKKYRHRRLVKARRAKRIYRRNRKVASHFTRLIRHRRRLLKPRSSGFVWMDGKQVCGWIANELERARKAGRWKGYITSGYRTPQHSQALCYAMCGRPSCPGRCAGTASNHTRGPGFPLGAVDVTDYFTLQDECRRLGLRIHNALPSDRVHFSNSGR
jgi:hypothetical protein